MRNSSDEVVEDAGSEESGDGFYGVRARPQRSRVAKKTEKLPRSKRIKRSAPIGGLHQRRNKRINW
ncbi:MAG: hypothetical protein WD851_21505 [Pirellulales bacterium]